MTVRISNMWEILNHRHVGHVVRRMRVAANSLLAIISLYRRSPNYKSTTHWPRDRRYLL